MPKPAEIVETGMYVAEADADNTISVIQEKILDFIRQSADGTKLNELKAFKDLQPGTNVYEMLSDMVHRGLIRKYQFKYYAE